MKVIRFEDKYRDDMIYMILSSKEVIGRIPRLNEDLLDIKLNYFDKGHFFWLALDEFDRVIGSIGTKEDKQGNVFLSRLYVKPSLKRKGIGSTLLKVAEDFLKDKGYKIVNVHVGKDYLESHKFYLKHGYTFYKDLYMKKKLK